jgi:hypothetical protein
VEGWTIFYMVVILKIPMVACLWLVWWAIKQEPDPEGATGEGGGPRRSKLPPLPRWPRRGPAGGGAGCKAAPCPELAPRVAKRAAPVFARRAAE